MPNTHTHSLLGMTPQQPSQAHGHVAGTNSAPSSGTTHANEEHLVNALHAALHSLSAPNTSPSEHTRTRSEGISPSGKEKPHAPTLDIVVASDTLHLRGTGVDVEPTLLNGNVVLHLAEPTSIKQVVLVFRGKARVPNNPHDPHVLNTSPSQYIVCSHEWTFLEGEKKHSHTLKAGRHLFPFELRLGGSLPSSLATYVNGGASISYKLRATAIRSGFSANVTASLPITLLRTFAPESLEYQQTLEIENTWPEKLMYALMIPHKAWAAGDELMALLKFAPLAKGVRVLSVATHLCETTKMLQRGGHLEKTRNVVTRKHDIVNGQAVCVEEQQRKRLHNALQSTLGEQNRQSSGLPGPSSQSGGSSPGYATGGTSAFVSGTSTPVFEGLSLTRSGTRDSSGSGSNSGSSDSTTNLIHQENLENDDSSEITTTISIPLPPSLTPSHSLDPIIVSYRVRWSVLLANLDGHTSELRCSLPLHVLDHSLLADARAATLATRRLLFGGEDAPRVEGEEDVQLPSYPSHVRDRIAVDMTLPEASPFRPFAQPDSGTTTPSHEGAHPLTNFPGFIQDPATSPFAFGAPLSRVQSQNVSSQQAGRDASAAATPPESSSAESSRPNTRPNSRHERDGTPVRETTSGWGPFARGRLHSRANSRAPSPERDHNNAATTTAPGVSRADETHIHVSNAASRHPHGLFSVTMKPLTRSTFAAPWHATSHTAALAQHFQHTAAHARRNANVHQHAVGTSASTSDLHALLHGHSYSHPHTPGTPGEMTGTSSSTVPDYFTAAHSGGSGVPPLETLRGLPTYEDSEAQAHGLQTGVTDVSGEAEPTRSFSDSDLVAHFARMRGETARVR